MVEISTGQRPNRFQVVNTAAYFLVFASVGVSLTVGGPALLALVGQTHSSIQAFGALFAIGPLGYMLGSWVGGRLYDRLPGHHILAASLIVMSGTLAVVPRITAFWVLIPFALFTSTAAGLLEVGCNVLLIWVHGGQVGPYMNGLHFSFGAGAVLTQLLIARIIAIGAPIVGAYWIIALALLPIAALVAARRSPARPAPARHVEPGSAGAQPRRLYTIALMILLASGIEASLSLWLFPYAVRTHLASEAQASLLTSAFWSALTVGRLAGIPLSVRYSAQQIILAGLLATVVILAAFVILPSQLAVLDSVAVGLGVALGPLVPNMMVLSERMGFATGNSTAIQLMAIGAGGLTLPVIISQFFDVTGPNVMLATLLSGSILALVVFAVSRFSTAKGIQPAPGGARPNR